MVEKPRNKRRAKAENELQELLQLAEKSTPDNPALARNAVRDAIRLSQTLRLRIPLEQKRRLCRKCYTYLKPGVTSTYRVAKGRVIITCKHCGNIKRLQYRR